MTNIAMVCWWPIEIDGLPMFTELKNGWIFPWRTVSHNQRVSSQNLAIEWELIPQKHVGLKVTHMVI